MTFIPLRVHWTAALARCALCCLLGAMPHLDAAQVPDSLENESQKKRQGFLVQGFNQTHSFSWSPKRKPETIRYRFWVVDPDQEVHFKFWFATSQGLLRVRLLSPSWQPIFVQSGASGEVSLTRRVPKGICILELNVKRTHEGRAEFAAKGSIISAVHLHSSRTLLCAASPSKGFHWPYLLYRPGKIKHPYLLVAPNNTGFPLEDLALLRVAATNEVRQNSSIAERLGCPLLVPLFPRPQIDGGNLYLHALSRESLLTRVPKYRRVDQQLLCMMQDARDRLQKRGLAIDPMALLYGFSASGSFVSRFAMLHPERVLAVACGSPGGWPIAPVARMNGNQLDYPVGIGDLESLSGHPVDWPALKSVAWFFFLGEKDNNDSIGNRDSFSAEDENLIRRAFGPELGSRWKEAERMYTVQGLRAEFHLYPGVAHVVAMNVKDDIIKFFENHVSKAARLDSRSAYCRPTYGHACQGAQFDR